MAYAIELKPSAAKELRRLPKEVQRRIAKAIDRLGGDPRPHGCTKLVGLDELYRIRLGDYRVIYQIRDKQLLVLVLSVAHRREAYR